MATIISWGSATTSVCVLALCSMKSCSNNIVGGSGGYRPRPRPRPGRPSKDFDWPPNLPPKKLLEPSLPREIIDNLKYGYTRVIRHVINYSVVHNRSNRSKGT